MKKIFELPEHIRLKLAAGEIIERPAYIVKELIDNAIDAHATIIRIDLEKNGLGKIIVTDNGIGMSREDLEISFKLHTTSKIKSEEDFEKIITMGFRGEALASIAAVAELTIASREAEAEFGYEIKIENSKLVSISPKGLPVGTQVKIEHIFSKLPVRKKFLRSEIVEYRNIIEIVTRYVLAFPSIRFDVYHNGKKVYVLTSSTIQERISLLFSQQIYEQLLPFQSKHEYISVTGFTSKPQLSYKSLRNIYFFVNNRYILDSSIVSAVKDTYGTLLEPAHFPHTILFLTIPEHLLDVNIHPRKEEIHFFQKEKILEHIKSSIQQVLSEANLRFYDKRWGGDNKEFDNWQIREGNTNTYVANKLRNTIALETINTIPQNEELFQFHNLYIGVPQNNGVLFFDQHAVHERILYEELQQKFFNEMKKGEQTVLKKTISLELSTPESLILEEFKDKLSQVGFVYTQEDDTVTFTAVPTLLKENNLEVTLREILDELFNKGESITFDYISHKLLSYLACRSAIKAGDYITKEQCRELIQKLQKTQNPYTCPHGRPTQVEVPFSYFHKLFKRKLGV